MLPGQRGRGRLDRPVVAHPGDELTEQRRDVGPGRVADEDGLPGQAGELFPADAIHDSGVRQDLGTVIGHSLEQGTPSVAIRIDDVPVSFSHEGPPFRFRSAATVTLEDNRLRAQRRKSRR
jgi:hypothetical protein